MSYLQRLAGLARIPGYVQLSGVLMLVGMAYSYAMPYTSLFGTTEVGMSEAQLGVFMTLMAVFSIVISTYLGKLSDGSINRKWILLFAVVCCAVGYLLFSFVRNYFLLLLVACVFLGIGSAAFPQLFAYARIRIQENQVQEPELAISTLRTFFSLAWVIGPVTGALLLTHFGFSWLYLGAALALLVSAVVIYRLKNSTGTAQTKSTPQPLGRILRHKTVLAIFSGFTMMSVASSLSMITLPLRVVQDLHGTKANVGFLFSLAAGLEIPFMIFFGLVAAKLPKGKLIIGAAVLQGVYFLMVSLATEVWHMVPAQVVAALVVSVTMGIGISYFQDLLPDEPGTATTLNANASRTGSILGGLVFGTLGGVLGYQGLFGLCTAMCWLAALLLFLFGRERHLQQYHQSRGVTQVS